MLNPGLPQALWTSLDGRLWHATASDGLSKILSDSEIQPAIGNRYKSSFCRSQGSVSLFDFGPAAVDIEGQFDNWCGWLGHQQESRVAIWLEIDRMKTIEALTDAAEARQKWHKNPSKTFIPGVESCHKGPIPVASVARVLLIARDDREIFEQYDGLNADVLQRAKAFERKLPAPAEDRVVEILRAGRTRRDNG